MAHTTTSETPATDRTFPVLLSRRDAVEAGLLAIAKRAAKKGLPALSWTWGKAFTEEVRRRELDGEEYTAVVSRVPLTLPIEAPKYAGWTFSAALQHLDGENVVRSVPGQTVPAEYRTRGPACDHCRSRRRRSDTYVLTHDDGRVVQVGSSCVADFLGSDDAGKLALYATLLADAASLAGEEGEGGYFGAPSAFVLSQFLPVVAWDVRVNGWVSRTVAREQGKTSSADLVWMILTDPEQARRIGIVADVADQDRELATAAVAWAESLTDAAVDAEKGDYLHNLRAVARTGLASFRTAGIVASVIVAYQRHVGRERERAERAARPKLNEHVGAVGDRSAFDVVLDFVTGYESSYGYTTVLKFRTPEGATIVWKSTSTEIARSDVGKRYVLVGTVKKFDEYKGEKQTIVTRCTVSERAKDDQSPIVQPPARKKSAKKSKTEPKVEPKKMDRSELDAHRATHDKSNSWWINDTKGIPLARVCDECREVTLSTFRPEVVGFSSSDENGSQWADRMESNEKIGRYEDRVRNEEIGRYEDVVEERIDEEA